MGEGDSPCMCRTTLIPHIPIAIPIATLCLFQIAILTATISARLRETTKQRKYGRGHTREERSIVKQQPRTDRRMSEERDGGQLMAFPLKYMKAVLTRSKTIQSLKSRPVKTREYTVTENKLTWQLIGAVASIKTMLSIATIRQATRVIE